MDRDDGELLQPMSPPAKPAHVLYFAALPPRDVRDRIATAWRRADIDAVFRERVLHLSIQGLAGYDEVPDDVIDKLRHAGDLAEGACFELCFDRIESFGRGEGKRPIVLSTDRKARGANDLAIAIRRALSRVGFPPIDTRKVEPHVTMAYAPIELRTEKLFQPFPWRVTEFSLVDSLQGKSQHVVLGTWQLGDERDPQGSLF